MAKNNTALYVGIGAVVLIGGYFLIKKNSTTIPVTPVTTNPNAGASSSTNTALNDATSIINNIL